MEPVETPRRSAARALVAGCVAIAGPGALIFGYPGVVAPRWQADLGLGRAAIGATLFFVLAAVGGSMFPVGRAQERWGTRRLVLAGEVLTAASLLFTSRPAGAWSLYLWGATVGAASCLVYLPCLTVAQLWFPTRRGLASGLVNLSFAGSAAVMAPALGWLLAKAGYAGTHLALATALLVVGGLAAAGVVAPPRSPAAAAPPPPSLTAAESLRTRPFWLLWFVWALQGAAGISMVTLAAPLAAAKGLALTGGVAVLTAFNVANGGSRLAAGLLSDRVGRRPALAAASLLAGAAYLALPAAQGTASTAALAVAIGTAFGTLFAVSAPLVVECFGPAHFGTVFGLVFTAYGFVSGALGPWLSGHLLDRAGGDPAAACAYLGCCCLLSAALVLGVRRPPPGG